MQSKVIRQTHAGERWIVDRWDAARAQWVVRYSYKRQEEAEADYEELASLDPSMPVRLRLVEL